MNEPELRHRYRAGTTDVDERDDQAGFRNVAIAAANNVPGRVKHKERGVRPFKQALESFENLPDYLRDNEYIVGSYRPEQSAWDSIRTIFSLHNETGNVWTHILGFFLFLGLAFYFFYHPPTPLAVTAEQVETLFHSMQHQLESLHVGDNLQALSHSLSDKVHVLEDKLSHALTGNLHVVGHSLHSLQDNLQTVSHRLQDNLHSLQDSLHSVEANLQQHAASLGSNLASKAGVLQAALQQQLKPIVQWPTPRWPGAAVVSMSLPTMFQAREYRAIRATVFTLLGAWGVVPVTHLLLSHGHVWAIRRAFQLDLLMGLIYVCGAVIYACRIPERWYPGSFDIFGHSHQLWHASVVLAAWVHYLAIMVLLQWRDASGGCAAPSSVNGPVSEVMQQLQQMGLAPLAIDQVYDSLRLQLQEYIAKQMA
eukprot:GHRR01011899.1.p1 GENE.GHRR01011899.1~~GHRR01011899.1.p1  ORF type:complete len:423 (+),score=147.84 GHRR01011899.1:118-1386(+)